MNPSDISPAPVNPVAPQPVNPAESTPKLPGAFALFKPSWQAVKLNFWTLFALFVATTGILLLAVLVVTVGMHTSNTVTITSTGTHTSSGYSVVGIVLLLVVTILVWLLFTPALIYTLLKGAKQEATSFSDAIKHGMHYSLRFFLVGLCTSLLVIVGLVLLVVPGLIMYRRYFLAPYYLIDRDLGVIEALKVSARESKPVSMAIWGVIGVEFLIGFISIIPILGWIASPILGFLYSAAPAVRYTQISSLNMNQAQPAQPPQPTQPQVQAPYSPAV